MLQPTSHAPTRNRPVRPQLRLDTGELFRQAPAPLLKGAHLLLSDALLDSAALALERVEFRLGGDMIGARLLHVHLAQPIHQIETLLLAIVHGLTVT